MEAAPKLKRSRNKYSSEFKLRFLEDYRKLSAGVKMDAKKYCKERNVPYGTYKEWKTTEAELRNRKDGDKSAYRYREKYAPLCPTLEDRLEEWILEERKHGRDVFDEHLPPKARELAAELIAEGDLTGNELHATDEFVAGVSWTRNFKKRKRFTYRVKDHINKQDPTELKFLAKKWRSEMRKKLTGVPPDEIANFDQTCQRVCSNRRKSLDKVGTHGVPGINSGNDKKGVTIGLTVSANGGKWPAYIVFRDSKGGLFELQRSRLPTFDHVVTDASRCGWHTKDIEERYLNFVNEHRTTRTLVLIRDQFPVHIDAAAAENVRNLLGREQELIPKNCTSYAQPLDLCIIKAFKDRYRVYYLAWKSQNHKTKTGTLRLPNRVEMVTWVSKAWDDVPAETVRRGFMKAGLVPYDNEKEDLNLSFISIETTESDENIEAMMVGDLPTDESVMFLFQDDE